MLSYIDIVSSIFLSAPIRICATLNRLSGKAEKEEGWGGKEEWEQVRDEKRFDQNTLYADVKLPNNKKTLKC